MRRSWILAAIALTAGRLVTACTNDDKPTCHSKVGSAGVNGSVTACPVITSYDVAPSQVVMGKSVQLTASATDPSGATLTYSWQSTSGVVADTHTASTTYRCTAPGPATLTITASNGLCDDTASAVVDCVDSSPFSPTPGDGGIDQ
jgi:hypothetical protein